MAEIKLRPERRSAQVIDKLTVGVPIRVGHAPFYQRSVDIASDNSFMARDGTQAQMKRVGFGARLQAAIKAAGFRSNRQFALALGWSEAGGPQRLSNYIKKDRVPDRLTLAKITALAKTTQAQLLNEAGDDAERDILSRLLELEGIPEDRADTISSAFLEAKRLLQAFPEDEGDRQTRARLAAHSAWQTQPRQASDR